MRKTLVLLLALTLLFAACGKVEPPVTTDAPETTVAPETTAIPETTAPPETTAVTEPPVRIEQPALETADKIEKQATDILFGGDFDFINRIEYPRIASDAPGAVALNQKIANLYAPLIEKLRNNQEDGELYRIGYTAAYTGKDYYTLMLRFTEYGGWQYSEAGTSQRFFYYDGKNGRELTLDEYLASMDIDKEKALAGALWSYDLARAGGTADYDGESTDHGAKTELRLPETTEILGNLEENTIYEQRFTEFANSVTLDGAYADNETVTLYFTVTMYTVNTFSVTLDRETLLPIRPNYEATVRLTAADTDKIEILFADGEIVSATAPDAFADTLVTVKSHKLCLPYRAELGDALLSVNGSIPQKWSHMGDTVNFYYDGYTAYDKLESIVLYVTPDTAPPAERATVYTRTAYSIYGGGGEIGKQYVTYPRVTTGTKAAEAFNEKITADYAPILENLEEGYDHKIYNITFDYTYVDGAFAFAVDQAIGRQGTEGGNGRKTYYFDVTNDCELTMDEYAARMGVDIEKAKGGALWSYDLGRAGYGNGDYTFSETVGGEAVTPLTNVFYYQKYGNFEKSVTVDGIAANADTVTLYLSGHAYISTIFTVELHRATLLPLRPNYALTVDVTDATEGDFAITIEQSKVTKVSLPCGIESVRISAASIHIAGKTPLQSDSLRLNGEVWGRGFSSSYDRDTESYGYSFSPDPYIPMEKLNTVTIAKR